ncbi:MAG TPA: hypothetical protein VGF69_06605 [Thermoanaerobaculia bacterium]
MTGFFPILIAVAVVVALVFVFQNMRRNDRLGELLKKRAAGAQVQSRASYVEANHLVPVALTLTGDSLHYENADLEASFELSRIDEVEYDDELVTGKNLEGKCRALRLRSHGAAFEFVLQPGDCEKWMAALPPRRMGEQTAHAV